MSCVRFSQRLRLSLRWGRPYRDQAVCEWIRRIRSEPHGEHLLPPLFLPVDRAHPRQSRAHVGRPLPEYEPGRFLLEIRKRRPGSAWTGHSVGHAHRRLQDADGALGRRYLRLPLWLDLAHEYDLFRRLPEHLGNTGGDHHSPDESERVEQQELPLRLSTLAPQR